MRMASASSSKGITAATGPNTSSVLTGSSGLAGAITVGGNQKPAPAGQLPRRAADPSGTYEATRARCSAEIRGPISVPSAAGSPTCKPRTAGSSSSMNSSNTCGCTRMHDRAHRWMGHQPLARHGPLARKHLHDPIRYARLTGKLADPHCRERGKRGRLDDDGVARGERGREPPGHDGHADIPRLDDSRHSERLTKGHVHAAGD